MARHLKRARVAALGLAAAMLAPLSLAGIAAAQPSGHRIDPGSLRGRSGAVVTDRAAPHGAASATARHAPPATTPRAAAPNEGSGRIAVHSPEGVGLATTVPKVTTSGECPVDGVDVNTLTDRSVVHLSQVGATSLTLMRRREDGAWRTVGTVAGPAGVLTDRGVNQRVAYQYRLVARTGSTTLADCVAADWFGIWTEDGWGDPDVVVAGSGGLFQQGRWSQGDRVASGSMVSPAYSTDGRLLAATRVVDRATGRAILEVRRASSAAVVFTLDLGPAVFPADPAFSPDGQTLAFARYDATTGEPQGLSFVDVFGPHTVRKLTTTTRIAEPVWRADGSTLVVSTFGVATPGLGLVCSTCSTVSPISGSAGGFTPEMDPDGSIWFGWSDGATHALRHRLGNGTVSDYRSSTTDVFYQPRFTPDERLYVELDTPSPVDPTRYDVDVHVLYPHGFPSDGNEDDTTSIGWERTATSISGWDVRQPQSKGTSDFYGEAHHDVIGRDSSGALWAYRNVGNSLTDRVGIGSGWGGFTAILAAGDLTGDDRADLVGRDAKGALWLYRGRATGGFAPRTAFGTGWGAYYLVATGDWNGDDKADIVARDATGTMWLYPGTGRGTLAPRVRIGSGWNGMNVILGSGDVDFDNRADLVSRDTAGRLWLYPGNGTGGFLARRQIGTGWSSFTGLAVSEVTSNRPYFWARQSDGTLISYEMTGDGVFSPGDVYFVASGWRGLDFTA